MLNAGIDYLGLIFIVAGAALLVAFWALVRQGLKPALRPLSGYDSFEEQIGQALESGGRVHVSLGPNSITGEETGTALAALALLDLAANTAAISDLPPIATTGDATVLPAAGDTLRRAYKQQGMPGRYHTTTVRLVALDPAGLAGGTTSLIHDEKVRANLLIGSYGPEVALVAEAGERAHTIQTVGSDRLEAQAVGYTMADHVLIGEEIYAARAYLSAEPSATAALAAEDVLRWVVAGLIGIGALLQTFGLIR